MVNKVNKLIIEVDSEAPKPICTVVHTRDYKTDGSRVGTVNMIQEDVACIVENIKAVIREGNDQHLFNGEKMKFVAIEYLKQSASTIKTFDAQEYPDQIKNFDAKQGGMKIIK